MSPNEFFTLLAALVKKNPPRVGKNANEGTIRFHYCGGRRGRICPVSDVANELAGEQRFLSWRYDEAGKFLGLPYIDAELIASAADGNENKFRTRLLQVCQEV